MGSNSLPPAGWVDRRSHHAFRYRKRGQAVTDRAEEAYLRLDIPCGSPSCAACAPTSPALPSQPAHLALPDAAALAGWLEVFELAEVTGVVLLSSVLRQLRSGGSMRRDARLRALYTDVRRRNVLFDNLHRAETAPASLHEQRCGLALLAAAEWYYEHLGRRLPVVVVSDSLAAQLGAEGSRQGQRAGQVPPGGGGLPGGSDNAGDDDAELDALLQQLHVGPAAPPPHRQGSGAPPAGPAPDPAAIASLLDSLVLDGGPAQPAGTPSRQQRSALPGGAAGQQQAPPGPGVRVLSAAAYFAGCWAHLPAVADAADALQQAAAAAAEAGRGGGGAPAFRPHLSAAALEAGLAAGSLLCGTLSVSRRARGEGSVALGGGRSLLVSGPEAMNRAVHGDRVALRLLPRGQWRRGGGDGLAAVAEGGADGEEGGEEGPHDLMAGTGDGEAGAEPDALPGDGEGEGRDPLEAEAEAGAGALQPTAEVVGVLQRGAGEVVACLAEEDERALEAKAAGGGGGTQAGSCLCVPLDSRLPKVRLRSRQLHRLLGQRFVLRLDGWERGSRYPHGHLVRLLGPINSLTSETDGVLVASGVHWQPFSEAALRELPPVASGAEYVMLEEEVAARRDLRGPDYLICSIDPPGCTDVDDALSVRWLDGGGDHGGGERRLVEVGVHIADVSYFVRQGSQLDGEAAARCTTVYLPDRRLDMLPALLSEDLCSLRAGADRYAVSVLWTLDADSLQVQHTWFGRTLIRSAYQLEYSQAQAVLDGRPQPLQPPAPGRSGGTGEVAVAAAHLPPLRRNLALLAALAEDRRRARLAAGALELESAELRFRLDGGGRPTAVSVKQEVPMMRVVAELMIEANAAVGRRLAAAFPRAALLRRHPPPRREALAEVSAMCESLGRPLDLEGGPAALAASLAAAAAAAPPALASLVRSLAARAMSEAHYFCTGEVQGLEGGGAAHCGLALPFYTHFTSPIRRYADVVAHRQLLAAVAAEQGSSGGGAGAPQAPPPLPGPEVAARAAVMNERHRAAKRAAKACSELYLLLLLHAQPRVEAATVYVLRPSALLLFLPRFHLRGVVRLVDRAGVVRPPCRCPHDDEEGDAAVEAWRRGLALESRGPPGGPPAELALLEAVSGRQLAAFRPMQRVWVRLSADASRAHGPRLRLRLLDEEHPQAVQAAAAAQAVQSTARQGGGAPAAPPAEAALGRAPAGAQGAPARAGWARAGHPPPGFEGAARPAAAAPAPPSAATVAAEPPDGQPAELASDPQAGLPSLARQLHAWLEQQQQQGQGGEAGGAPQGPASHPLDCQATVPPLDHLPGSSSSSSDGVSPVSAALQRAVRRLHGRAARLSLAAAARAPGGAKAERCRAEAADLRQRILDLQQHLVPG